MFANASSSVAPCDQHPGRPGQETLYPSSVGIKATGYFILPTLASPYLAIAGIVLKAPVPLNFRPSTLIWPATGVRNSRVPRRCAVLDAYRDTRSKDV